jgi:hypothetical protein
MSNFEHVDTRTLMDILAKRTQELTKLIRAVTGSKKYKAYKKELEVIQEELERRKEALFPQSDQKLQTNFRVV